MFDTIRVSIFTLSGTFNTEFDIGMKIEIIIIIITKTVITKFNELIFVSIRVQMC